VIADSEVVDALVGNAAKDRIQFGAAFELNEWREASDADVSHQRSDPFAFAGRAWSRTELGQR
jgi:hypothetical protein